MKKFPLFFPVSFIFIFLFTIILGFLFIFFYIGLIGAAFEKLGISPSTAFILLLLSLFGSSINIPIKTLSHEEVISGEVISFFGIRYVIPYVREKKVILAVNVGGAIIPTLVSIYLVERMGITSGLIISILTVTLIVNRLARPVRGVGIAMPALIPPILAAFAAVIFAPENSPAVAYVSGTMGTLIGADIMNLNKIKGLGAPVASIGGAGTFDGIFLTGILAVILA